MTPESDPYVVEWESFRDRLATAAREDAGWYQQAAKAIVRQSDRIAVDVGCGGAGMAAALAGVLAPEARVLGLDGNAEVLDGVRENLARAGLGSRVELREFDLEGDLDSLRKVVPGPVDVLWAAGVVHHAGDQQAVLDTLAQLLAPGGRLALGEGGLRARHLPWDVGIGRPGLETRLEAAQDAWFGRMRTELPGSVRMPYGWTTALRRAGLERVTTWSVLLEKPAPLGEPDRQRVADRLKSYVERLRPTGLLAEDDLAAWDRLTDPADAVWLGSRDDVFMLEARSVHAGMLGEPRQ